MPGTISPRRSRRSRSRSTAFLTAEDAARAENGITRFLFNRSVKIRSPRPSAVNVRKPFFASFALFAVKKRSIRGTDSNGGALCVYLLARVRRARRLDPHAVEGPPHEVTADHEEDDRQECAGGALQLDGQLHCE